LAYIKPTGKKKLQADLAQQKVRVTQAQDKLNATVNGVPLDPNSIAYKTADAAFIAAVKEQTRLQGLLDNYKEPEKKLSAKEIEAKRQADIKAGNIPPVGGVVSGQPNTDQTKVVDDFDSLLKSAKTFLRNMSDEDRLIIATQLANAGYEVPKIKAYNDSLLGAYNSLIQGAKSKNKEFPDDIKTVNDFLAEQTNIALQIKAAGGGDDERYKPFGQQEIYNRSTAEGVIDSIFASLNLGREANKTEIDTLYKQLEAEQKKLSSMSKGTYKMVNGRRVLVQESGLDARTFLENKVKELPAYKESQAAKSEKSKISLASTTLANGYNLETDFAMELPGWLESINSGKSIDDFKNIIRTNARRILPESVRNQIAPDEDLSTTFSTYMSNIAKAKGVPVNTIRVQDVIPLAITDKGFADTKQFEVNKRSQAWWDESPEGISVTTTVLNDTLKDFGLLGQGVRTV
jgi:hypothetical protein